MIEMTNRLPIQRCQYCGCEDIGLGWQHGEALVTFKKHGMLGNRLRYLICRRCGGRLRLSAGTDEDLDRLCCQMTLTIRGVQ